MSRITLTDTRNRILQAAHELFYQFGIRSITMDDIASHLSISKKTIYRFFAEKEEIVHSCCTEDLKHHFEQCEQINNDSRDAVHEMMGIMKFVSQVFASMHPSLFFDLKKYHPRSYQAFRHFKEKQLLSMVEANLERGIAEGLYREGIPVKILSKLRIELVELGMNAEIFPPEKFDYPAVQLALIDHFLHGIVTIKGHRLIEKYRSAERNNR